MRRLGACFLCATWLADVPAFSSPSRCVLQTVGDLGFGNQVGTGKHPDWTFAANANTYSIKTIRAYVSRDPGLWAPANSCSYENDINARCKDATNTFKMSNCCDGGGYDLVAHPRAFSLAVFAAALPCCSC